jgi:hypothetical protein
VSSAVLPVGTVDRVLEIPPRPWDVGWWEDGVGLGSPQGTVVLVARLDSAEYGKGPFRNAVTLPPGARMTLTGPGIASAYQVAPVETCSKEVLPYEELFAQDGPGRVVPVTCGGTYRSSAGWDSDVVVTLTPVSTRSAD